MEGSPPPNRNKLLATLSASCLRQVQRCLVPHTTPAGAVLYRQGDNVRWLYFPVSGVIARFLINEEAESTEFSVCANEGAIGIMGVLGGPAMGTAMALCDSTHYRCSGENVRTLMDAREFRAILLLYTRYMISEIIQTSLCNKHHSTEQRFCRWLLMCLDRAPASDLELTHEVIARLLGVRREGISEVAGRLRAEGVINMGRRQMVVLDREALLARSCDCYATLNESYRRLFAGPEVSRIAQG